MQKAILRGSVRQVDRSPDLMTTTEERLYYVQLRLSAPFHPRFFLHRLYGALSKILVHPSAQVDKLDEKRIGGNMCGTANNQVWRLESRPQGGKEH